MRVWGVFLAAVLAAVASAQSPVGNWVGKMRASEGIGRGQLVPLEFKLKFNANGTYESQTGSKTGLRKSAGKWVAEKGGVRLMPEKAPAGSKGMTMKFAQGGKMLVMEVTARVSSVNSSKGQPKPNDRWKPTPSRIEFTRAK